MHYKIINEDNPEDFIIINTDNIAYYYRFGFVLAQGLNFTIPTSVIKNYHKFLDTLINPPKVDLSTYVTKLKNDWNKIPFTLDNSYKNIVLYRNKGEMQIKDIICYVLSSKEYPKQFQIGDLLYIDHNDRGRLCTGPTYPLQEPDWQVYDSKIEGPNHFIKLIKVDQPRRNASPVPPPPPAPEADYLFGDKDARRTKS